MAITIKIQPLGQRHQWPLHTVHGRDAGAGDPPPAASGIGVLHPLIVESPEPVGGIHVDPASIAQADHEPAKRRQVFIPN
jgi:hypothetical protein